MKRIIDALLWTASGVMITTMIWLALFIDWTPPIGQ